MMRPQDFATLAAEMATTGVARLELTGPGFTLSLARGGAQAGEVPAPPAPNADLVPVSASALGSFLRTHPLHEKPLAVDGEAVVAGQPIALLQVGALLVPMPAPADGMIVAAIPEEGALVGYGDRLCDFLPND
jgi:acetyl-CoA carboxylase biotin carboxyl carrier protein